MAPFAKRYARVAITAILFVSVVAYFVLEAILVTPSRGDDGFEAKWQEEVELADGSIVLVDRYAFAAKHGQPGARKGPTVEWRISIPERQIRWVGGRGVSPLALEIANQRVFIAVMLLSRELCMQHDYPPRSTVYFAWDGKAWAQIQSTLFPKGGKANLLAHPWAQDRSNDAAGLIKSDGKSRVLPYNDRVNKPLQGLGDSRGLGFESCAIWKESLGTTTSESR